MDLSWFFQFGATPQNAITGYYNYPLVALSYVIAVLASYVALDLAGRLRAEHNNRTKLYWLIGGAFAMGAGIWSMHFIGMLAFVMPMPMSYDWTWTSSSMLAAALASAFALYLLRTENRSMLFMGIGGILLGLGIATMHYMGMQGMASHTTIHYLPSLFFLSIIIAILASEAALWLILLSNQGTFIRQLCLKIASAFVMGAAICGMHYTGMAAAVFTSLPHPQMYSGSIEPFTLAYYIAAITGIIILIALIVSTYKQIRAISEQREKELLAKEQLAVARKVGMAEVADSVLHNVGNVLNSIIVSVSMIQQKVSESKVSNLKNLSDLFNQHGADIGNFITQNPQGQQIPKYIPMLAETWEQDKKTILAEVQTLEKNIQHVKNIIAMQQKLSGAVGLVEETSVSSQLEDALNLNKTALDRGLIRVTREYTPLSDIHIDRVKFLQIIVNLIRNSVDSLLESNNDPKQLTLHTAATDDAQIIIKVIDNGLGIKPENTNKIFSHGFTTKKNGHGFGLHTSAIAAQEMGGRLSITSEGEGKGAVAELILPTKPTRIREHNHDNT